jgi:glycosyltransferase involved in cell wall biosynthesis
MKSKDITVAVVCFNEIQNIGKCLDSLLSQSIEPYQILVIDNGSTDGTVEVIRRYEKENPVIKMLTNPIIGIARSRNIAVGKCLTKLLAFTDADTYASKDWLKKLQDGFTKYRKTIPHLVAVGGSNVPTEQLLALYLDSFLGTGTSIQGRIYPTDRLVSHIPCVNVLYDLQAVRLVNGFDESLGNIIEDEDLTLRLCQHHYQFMYIHDAFVNHAINPNWGLWLHKMFLYGVGRSIFVIKHPETISLKFIMPILLIITTGAYLHAPWITYAFWFPYIFGVLISSVWIGYKRSKPLFILPLFCLYPLSHLYYGLGEIFGLLFGLIP